MIFSPRGSANERAGPRAKLDRANGDLSIRRQWAMLGLARSGVYRKPHPANDNDLEAMRRIDALFTARPFFGARGIARTLSEGSAFTGVLIEAGVRISMDGRGRWIDNVFIERVWRSLKHQDVYLKGYADGCEAKAGIAEYFVFYNEQPLHQALDYRAPMAVWRKAQRGSL